MSIKTLSITIFAIFLTLGAAAGGSLYIYQRGYELGYSNGNWNGWSQGMNATFAIYDLGNKSGASRTQKTE